MTVSSNAVLLLTFICGLPSTRCSGQGTGKLPETFIGIFRNDQDKQNLKRALCVFSEIPGEPEEPEGHFLRIKQQDSRYEFCPSSCRACIPFKLEGSSQDHITRDNLEVVFNLTEDQTTLNGSIETAQNGIVQLQFTASEKGVELLYTYGNYSHPEAIGHKAFYHRAMPWYTQGMFEMDMQRTTSETINKANSMFHPINSEGSFSFSVDTRIWIRELRKGHFLYTTLFSAAYQWSDSFRLLENSTFYSQLFNGTTEDIYVLEKSTPTECVLESQARSLDGRFSLTTRTVFERNAVKQILTFNGEQVTLYYQRIVEDLLYGSYEEVSMPGDEVLSDHLKMACPGPKSGARLNISRRADKTYSIHITPCEGADHLRIPFELNEHNETILVQHNNGTTRAYFSLGEGSEINIMLHQFLEREHWFSVRIKPDARRDRPIDTLTGILVSFGSGPSNYHRSFKFRRVFPSHMFGVFHSTNDTSAIAKSVLEFSLSDDGNFVGKRSVGQEKPTTTKFIGSSFWLDEDTKKSGEYFYFEFAGDGIPAILRLQRENEYPYRIVGGETMIFRPDGVEVHTSNTLENKHTKRFYSRVLGVKS